MWVGYSFVGYRPVGKVVSNYVVGISKSRQIGLAGDLVFLFLHVLSYWAEHTRLEFEKFYAVIAAIAV